MSRSVTTMTIYDVDHYTDAEKESIVASYPAHTREARASGVPTLGSGRIFPIPEEDITVDDMPIPRHWAQINGLDFGWHHPFAAVNLAWDRDYDCVYVTKTYRKAEATPVIHAASVRPWGEWIPCAWPHDGYQHDKGSGDQLSEQYRKQHLKMLDEHATWPEGGFGTEAGLMEMLDRMQTDRFRVFRSLNDWWEEFRMYHREEGKVVKLFDDLMSATRIGVMMLRSAQVRPSGRARKKPRLGTTA